MVKREGEVHKVYLKKVGVLSLAKLQGLIGVIFGLITGIIFFIAFSIVGGTINSAAQQLGGNTMGGTPFIAGGLSMLIILPIAYGIMFFIVGIIGAWIYNLVAKWVGGLEIHLRESP